MISSVYAAWSEGTAATGFEYSQPRWKSASNENETNGMWPEIGPIRRVVAYAVGAAIALRLATSNSQPNG